MNIISKRMISKLAYFFQVDNTILCGVLILLNFLCPSVIILLLILLKGP